MEERLARLEQVVDELRQENLELRSELDQLQALIAVGGPDEGVARPRTFRARWSVVVLAIALVAVPVIAYSGLHFGAVLSTVIGALNGLVLFIIGPAAWRLLIEGLFRAIPTVVFGQATRIAWDRYKQKRKTR